MAATAEDVEADPPASGQAAVTVVAAGAAETEDRSSQGALARRVTSGGARIRSHRSQRTRAGLGQKFGRLVVVLLLAMLAVTMVALNGLAALAGSADDLYNDEVQSVTTLSELRDELQTARALALALIPANDVTRQDLLVFELENRVAPAVERGLADLDASVEDGGDGVTHAEVVRLTRRWRSFHTFIRSEHFTGVGPNPEVATLDDSVVDETDSRFELLGRDITLLVRQAERDAGRQAAAAQRQFADARNRMFAVGVAALLAGVGLAIRLSRDVVGRTRSYSRFAGTVAEGTATSRLDPSGNDELTELGHALNRMADGQTRAAADHERKAAFTSALQVVGDEDESHILLRRHLERSVPDSTVVVLGRNNSADRLEARTPLPVGSILEVRLADAIPDSCRAIRSGRSHHEDLADDPLITCGVCSGTSGASTCVPLLVGGEVIGSVLTRTPVSLNSAEVQIVENSVSEAAPVIANLRNLSIAEHRANIDALTGLASRRVLRETLPRLVAQAGRQDATLAALFLDLDHFKNVNDTYGHEVGDQVLAAASAAIATVIRASDFAARYGGDEFLVLLPATSVDAACHVADKIRREIALVRLPEGPPVISASVGVAVLPNDADDGAGLIRMADRALYAAKRAGRDRVLTADASLPPSPEEAANDDLSLLFDDDPRSDPADPASLHPAGAPPSQP